MSQGASERARAPRRRPLSRRWKATCACCSRSAAGKALVPRCGPRHSHAGACCVASSSSSAPRRHAECHGSAYRQSRRRVRHMYAVEADSQAAHEAPLTCFVSFEHDARRRQSAIYTIEDCARPSKPPGSKTKTCVERQSAVVLLARASTGSTSRRSIRAHRAPPRLPCWWYVVRSNVILEIRCMCFAALLAARPAFPQPPRCLTIYPLHIDIRHEAGWCAPWATLSTSVLKVFAKI